MWRPGFRAMHLPAFAFALFVAEYDFDVWELACFLCVFDSFFRMYMQAVHF